MPMRQTAYRQRNGSYPHVMNLWLSRGSSRPVRMPVQRRRRRSLLLLAVATGLAAVVLAPGLWWTEAQFEAWTAGVQAVGVMVGLSLGVATLIGERSDRQVDRTLALHLELTDGSTSEARIRLVDHIRAHSNGPLVRPISERQLKNRKDPIAKYATRGADSTPRRDTAKLIRFFERAWMAQQAGAVNEPLFVELIGRQAAWWNLAIDVEHSNSKKNLNDLATWANEFALRYRDKYPFLADWGATRLRDFQRLAREHNTTKL